MGPTLESSKSSGFKPLNRIGGGFPIYGYNLYFREKINNNKREVIRLIDSAGNYYNFLLKKKIYT